MCLYMIVPHRSLCLYFRFVSSFVFGSSVHFNLIKDYGRTPIGRMACFRLNSNRMRVHVRIYNVYLVPGIV